MPLKDDLPADCLCDNVNSTVKHTLFMGLSVESFSGNFLPNGSPSSLTVTLYEDCCASPKCCYTECLEEINGSFPDPGFWGDPRWERGNGNPRQNDPQLKTNEYSSCTPEHSSDILIRPAINIEGTPAFFRLGTFEWCGIIKNWRKDIAKGGTKYTVDLESPSCILDNINVIIGEYSGCIDLDIPGKCPPVNTINAYGLAESFGVFCPNTDFIPGVGQGPNSVIDVNGTKGCQIDGSVFGTPNGRFGASCWTQDGMPASIVLQAITMMLNSIPPLSGDRSCFSPYGRAGFCKVSHINSNGDLQYGFPPGSNWCGLMDDSPTFGCADDLESYCVDISDLPYPVIYIDQNPDSATFGEEYTSCKKIFDGDEFVALDKSYRLSGTSMNLTDIINQMAQDFGFDWYCELIPIKVPDGDPCVKKFIKIRVIDRTANPTPFLCPFLDNYGCYDNVTQGRELTLENKSRFITGACKQTIHQACQNTNPDGGVDGVFTGLNPDTGLIESGTWPLDNNTISTEADDMIIPYYGKDVDGDIKVVYKNLNNEYCVKVPVSEIAGSIRHVVFNDPYISICESELKAALAGFDAWMAHTLCTCTTVANGANQGDVLNCTLPGIQSEIGVALRNNAGFANLAPLRACPVDVDGIITLPGDLANPAPDRMLGVIDNRLDDLTAIYEWVLNYAREYYGKSWAVRVPFTCCYIDTENVRVRYSDTPTNDGGWTECADVLDLPNGNQNFLGQYTGLNFFKDDVGKIQPFVCFKKGLNKDLGSLSDDDYWQFYEIGDTLLTDAIQCNGPPVLLAPNQWGCEEGGDSLSLGNCNAFLDLNNGDIYSVTGDGSGGIVPIRLDEMNRYCADGPPTVGFCFDINTQPPPNTTPGQQPPFIWIDKNTCEGYLVCAIESSSIGNDPDCAAQITSLDAQGTINCSIYVKAQVETKYCFHRKSDCFIPRAIISIPNALWEYENDDLWGISGVLADGSTQGGKKLFYGQVGGEDAWENAHPCACNIDAAAIPIKHYDTRYGPWCNPSQPSWGGEIIQDDTYAPWNFGGYTQMNTAGQFFANCGRIDNKSGDIGSITVPGTPSLPIGAELGINDAANPNPYQFGANYLIETRTTTEGTGLFGDNPTYEFIDFGGPWTGIYGPNITSINVSIDSNCNVKTTYGMSAFTPTRTSGDRRMIDALQRANKNQSKLLGELRRLQTIVDDIGASSRSGRGVDYGRY